MSAAWFDHGRPALFKALNAVCDQIGRDIDAELQRTNADAREAIDFTEQPRAEQNATVASLGTQDPDLRNHSARSRSTTIIPNPAVAAFTKKASHRDAVRRAHLNDASSATPPSTDDPEHIDPPSCQICVKHLRRYYALSANFRVAKEALQHRRNERNKWICYAEYLRKKIALAEERYGVEILEQKARSVEVPSAKAREADDGTFNPALSFMSDSENAAADDEPELPELPAQDALGGELPPFRLTNSQSTQGQASDEPSEPVERHLPSSGAKDSALVSQEPSSDIPEIISEREVKKRKRGDGDSVQVIVPLVKEEPSEGSSPIMAISPVRLLTQESIDLGDIAQKVQTPRKRQCAELDTVEVNTVPLPRLGIFTPEHGGNTRQAQSAQATRMLSALTPLDVNARIIRPATDKRVNIGKRRQHMDENTSLAEHGAAYRALALAVPVDPENVRSGKSRLNTLLDGSAKDVGIDISPLRRTHLADSARGVRLSIPDRRQLPFDKDASRPNETNLDNALLNPELATESGSPVSLEQHGRPQLRGSLRLKPISELRLTDFKINPAANEGHDFAFSEVVRDRDVRACLPGCVDMHCCGKTFRALAISQRPDAPLTAAERQEEQRLLESYLGDFSYRLASMDREERLGLWIEAKTQELANKYGKHRHRFTRMQSPPGFWDADFPSTQQLQADKAESEKRVRRAVADRYREAMKPDGRWKFTDE
ncbi:DNA repair protein Sae2/CtIP [Moelleriella libera RCEF 2490]|uniref:DNA repair protein Sae2/CtIP n=1 Tax=Moelleriella libera RCEF 2490 TaxID=1081109 RepID=A0A166VAN7_9HYPO|nr:DNA repair protein Sae2/CtIP [Moelleriella libera RCEF 2490]